jgi:hypothetical protein
MFDSIVKVVLAIAVVVVLIAIGPWLVIWSLNTLFPVLAIPYTFWTWLAVLIMGTFLKGSVTYKK